MTKQTDVIIIGGGMAGLSMAIALAKLELSVVVVDRASFDDHHLPAFDGRVSAISLGWMRMLARLGVWDDMQPHAEPILDIRVSDGQSPFFLHYDHQEVDPPSSSAAVGHNPPSNSEVVGRNQSSNSEAVGHSNNNHHHHEPFGWIVENRHTRMALYGAASQFENITFHQASIKSIDEQGACHIVTLDNGAEFQASLAIGADGKFSKLRELAGIAVHKTDYKQTGIVCTIAHEQPHQGLAQERFLARGPFAVLPMQDNRSSLVWVEPEHLAKHYLELSEEDINQEIQERVGDYLGKISITGERFSYPLNLTLAEQFTASRMVLIGDAAHAIHPIAGQGINLGFRDVAVLAELIETQHKLGQDIAGAAVMDDYSKWRRLDTLAMAGVTDSLNRLFSTSLLPAKLARGLGYLPWVKCRRSNAYL